MKLLFLIFHGFGAANGISKKIHYQVKALTDCGVETHLCWIEDNENGHKYRIVDDKIIKDYGAGIKSKILKRTSYGCIVDYARENGITHMYIRCDHNTTPFLIDMMKRLKKLGVTIAMEIPTYPYDQEYKDLSWKLKLPFYVDKMLRGSMAKYIDKIVTFSDHKTIFGRPTIHIANGIDFDAIPKRVAAAATDDTIHMIAVADMHPWHGFDRAIRGLADYLPKQTRQRVVLHLVGGGSVSEVIDLYHKIVDENGLAEYVVFHGPLFGEELDKVFDMCQIGIGSLARHRSGITHLRSLKNREYAARGIPFVYSEIDDDFEQMPYIMKVAPDESNLNIDDVIAFYKSVGMTADEIRSSIEQTLAWKVQMKKVIDNLPTK
jgi:glycosyltransferase involved in cell wall biosynthesis